MAPYEFLEDVATADIAFRAWGETIEELFRAAADATMNVMVEDLDSIRAVERRDVAQEADDLEMLLFGFLQELIFLKDAELLLTRVGEITIRRGMGTAGHRLGATLTGERIDPARHRMRVDVKAVTLHRYRLERKDLCWEAMVILDV